MPDWLAFALLFPAGVIAGVVNVLAGGGSFLTLPLLIATGLPAHIANGTNRIAVLTQAVVATRAYSRAGQLDRGALKLLLPPLVVGAALGAFLATQISPERLERAFGLLFLGLAALLLWSRRQGSPRQGAPHPSAPESPTRTHAGAQSPAQLQLPRGRRRLVFYAAFFAIGVYGGFLQAGVGLFLMLGSTALLSMDAVRANALKLALVLVFTTPAFFFFVAADQVRWLPGSLLALGTLAGSRIGVKLTLRRGPELIWRAVIVVLLVTGAYLTFH